MKLRHYTGKDGKSKLIIKNSSMIYFSTMWDQKIIIYLWLTLRAFDLLHYCQQLLNILEKTTGPDIKLTQKSVSVNYRTDSDIGFLWKKYAGCE